MQKISCQVGYMDLLQYIQSKQQKRNQFNSVAFCLFNIVFLTKVNSKQNKLSFVYGEMY